MTLKTPLWGMKTHRGYRQRYMCTCGQVGSFGTCLCQALFSRDGCPRRKVRLLDDSIDTPLAEETGNVTVFVAARCVL